MSLAKSAGVLYLYRQAILQRKKELSTTHLIFFTSNSTQIFLEEKIRSRYGVTGDELPDFLILTAGQQIWMPDSFFQVVGLLFYGLPSEAN